MCHYSGDAPEIDALVEELKLRGIPVWVYRDGGFRIGDNTQEVAREVIADGTQTFGLMLYATPTAMTREFIRRIELHEAVRRKERDPDYLLMAVVSNMGFDDLARLSVEAIGEDLSIYHAHSIAAIDAEGIRPQPLRPQFQKLANKVLDYQLHTLCHRGGTDGVVGINLCTRDHLPPDSDDCLDIDATWLLNDVTTAQGRWE